MTDLSRLASIDGSVLAAARGSFRANANHPFLKIERLASVERKDLPVGQQR
jgi:hypothetical protein